MFAFAKPLVRDLAERFARHGAIAMIGIGLTFVIVVLLVKYGVTHTAFFNISLTIASAVLSGGVFTWLTKTAQIKGVFREDMESIVYSTEHALVRKDVDKLWANVTRALYSSAFAPIENKIYDAIRAVYLPKNNEFYYQDLTREVSISVIDFEKQIVDVEVFASATLIPSAAKASIDRVYSISVDSRATAMALPTINSVLRDKVTRTVLKDANGEGSGKSGVVCVLADIPTDKEVIVEDRVRFTQCLLEDNLLMWRALSYVDKVKITVHNANRDRLLIQHRSIGKMELKEGKGVRDALVVSIDDLIFAGQGVMLSLQIIPEVTAMSNTETI